MKGLTCLPTSTIQVNPHLRIQSQESEDNKNVESLITGKGKKEA